MQKSYLKQIQLLLILLITSLGFSQTVVTVSEDSFVRGGTYADTNYNGERIVIKESEDNPDFSRRSYMKFDVSSFSSITSATLNFSGNQSSGDAFTITIHSISDDNDSWSESTLTWTNAPVLGTVITTFDTNGDIGASTDYALHAIDLTSHVQSELSTGNKIISIGFSDALLPIPSEEQFRIYHKEGVQDIPNNIITANLTLIGAVLGVDNEVVSKFTMYPNPTQDSVVIKKSNSNISNVSIFSVNGSVVFNSKNINASTLKIDTSDFQTGVYFVKIINVEGGLSVNKLIKK